MVFRIGYSSPQLAEFLRAAASSPPGHRFVVDGGIVRTVSKRSPELTDEVNIRTRRAFSRAVQGALSSTKIQHICARYKIDWDGFIRSPLPLKRFYVDAFGVGVSCLSTYNLKENWWLPWWSLSKWSPEEVRTDVAAALRHSFLGETLPPEQVKGGATKEFQMIASDLFITDKQRASLFSGIGDLVSKDLNIPFLHPYYSRLAMGIICHMEGKFEIRDKELIIPAPGRIQGEVDYYRIHEIVSYGGLTAVFLTPISQGSHLAPLVAFRCTQQTLAGTDAILSLMNDIEENIGESGYIASKEALTKIMNNPAFHLGRKIRVLGYSLGGAHASHFMRDHWQRVEEFIAFNFCGNSDEVIEQIASEINALPEEALPPRFFLHRNVCTKDGKVGDWVNKIGDKHIGWGIKHPRSVVHLYEWLIHDQSVTENVYNPGEWVKWSNLHATRPMDDKNGYTYTLYKGHQQCTPRLDTKNRDGGLERQRRLLGPEVFSTILRTTYSALDFFLRAAGIEFFRRNMR